MDSQIVTFYRTLIQNPTAISLSQIENTVNHNQEAFFSQSLALLSEPSLSLGEKKYVMVLMKNIVKNTYQ